MAFRMMLNVCCEYVELNTSRQNLRYELDTGVIRSDTEEYARCFNCGDRLSGELYVDCGISQHTGTIKTMNELAEEDLDHNHTGMSE